MKWYEKFNIPARTSDSTYELYGEPNLAGERIQVPHVKIHFIIEGNIDFPQIVPSLEQIEKRYLYDLLCGQRYWFETLVVEEGGGIENMSFNLFVEYMATGVISDEQLKAEVDKARKDRNIIYQLRVEWEKRESSESHNMAVLQETMFYKRFNFAIFYKEGIKVELPDLLKDLEKGDRTREVLKQRRKKVAVKGGTYSNLEAAPLTRKTLEEAYYAMMR